jgi:hypothetical protein
MNDGRDGKRTQKISEEKGAKAVENIPARSGKGER